MQAHARATSFDQHARAMTGELPLKAKPKRVPPKGKRRRVVADIDLPKLPEKAPSAKFGRFLAAADTKVDEHKLQEKEAVTPPWRRSNARRS